MLNKKILIVGFFGLGAYLYYKNSLTVQYDNYLMGDYDNESGGFIEVSAGYIREIITVGKPSELVSENYKGLLPLAENGQRAGFKGGKWYPYTDNRKSIAFGHVILAGENFDKGITTDYAYELMLKDIDINCKPVLEFRSILTQGQFDAACDFCYNAGGGTFRKKVAPKMRLSAGLGLEAMALHYANIGAANPKYAAGWFKRSKIQQAMAGRGIYSVNV